MERVNSISDGVNLEEAAENKVKEEQMEGGLEADDAENKIEKERKALEAEIEELKAAAEERKRRALAHLETLQPEVAIETISPVKIEETDAHKREKNQDKLKSYGEEGQENGMVFEDLEISASSFGGSEFKEKIFELIDKDGDLWSCKVCGKSAQESKARDRLKNHVQIHMDLTHACDLCGKTCSTKGALGQHMYKQHRDVVEEIIKRKNESKQFRCDLCGKKSTTKTALDQHMVKRHLDSISERKVNVEKPFECKICGKSSTTRKALEQHKYKRHASQEPPS